MIFEALIRESSFACLNIDEIDYFHCVARFKAKAMAAATQLAMSASSFLCPTAIASKKVGSSNTQYFVTPTTLVVCQQDNKERKTADVSRR